MNNDLNNDRLLIVNFGGHTQWNSIFKLLEGKKKTGQPRIPHAAKIPFHEDIFNMRANRICCQQICTSRNAKGPSSD